MAEPRNIESTHGLLRIVMSDGTAYWAYPISTQYWAVGEVGDGGGTGPVDPEPGSGLFTVPFPFDIMESVGEYGPRFGRFHEGVDFPGGRTGVGADIKAAGDGVVAENYVHGAFGNLLIIDHGVLTSGTHAGKRVRSLYAHLIAPSPLAVGTATVRGVTVVGGVGNTGSASDGAHLHHEIHITEPGNGIVWNTADNGGFRTAVSPKVFYAEYGS